MLGLWATSSGGDDAETTEFWMSMLSELKDRGVADVFFVVYDGDLHGLTGLPDAIAALYPRTVVQTSILHLLRDTFQYTPPKDWGKLAADLKPICGAPTRNSAWRAFETFENTWSATLPRISQLWRDAWEQFAPFLDYDVELRRILCRTDAEMLDAHHRRTMNVRRHLPAEQAALNVLHLTTRTLRPHSNRQARPTTQWKPTLDALTASFADRMPQAEDT